MDVVVKIRTGYETSFIYGSHISRNRTPQLPNDQDFAHIEKRKRKEQVFIPKDWIRFVEHSRMVKQYYVINMKHEDVVAYNIIAETTFRNTLKDGLHLEIPIYLLR